MTNDELKVLCESNARSTAANSDAITQTNANISQLAQLIARAEQLKAQQVSDLQARQEASDQRFENLLAEAREDRKRIDAVQENIQRLLLELTQANGRIERLEQAS